MGMLRWADEPLASPRRFGFDIAVYAILGVAAHLLFGVDWMVVPVLIAGRCAGAAVVLLRREAPNDRN